MNFVAKKFEELTTKELYEILKARAKVFIVEQGIQCQDMDDVDYKSLHCYYEENGIVTAYLRAYYGKSDGEVRIGRVLTVEHGKGLGKQLMEKSMQSIREKLPCKKMCLDAQSHAIGFYEKLGFQVISDEFMEEGVPHVEMEKTMGSQFHIRAIQARDNVDVESIIRTCLIEFGGNREGTAWCDPDLGRFSEIYNKEGHKYWVIEDEGGQVVGGAGIGALCEDVCELQKMYCLSEVRGTGIAKSLMERCLKYAAKYYKKCYLETFSNMIAANKFYQKHGFHKLEKPYIVTEHFSCDVWYIKDLV